MTLEVLEKSSVVAIVAHAINNAKNLLLFIHEYSHLNINIVKLDRFVCMAKYIFMTYELHYQYCRRFYPRHFSIQSACTPDIWFSNQWFLLDIPMS